MANTFIYALCEPGTRTVRYIGKANDPKRRLREHINRAARTNTHLGNWLRSLLSLGEKPSLVVLREVSTEQWELAEERYIRLARGIGMCLTNATDGGDGVPMTPEMRKRISLSSRGRRASLKTRAALSDSKKGPKNPCFGKVYSEEEKRVRSEALRGPKNHNFGVKFSDERRAQISASLRGRTQSLETRAKRSASIRAFHEARKAHQV